MGLGRKRALSRPLAVPSEASSIPRRTRIGKEEREGLLLEEFRKSGRGFPEGVARRGEDSEGRGPDFLFEDPSGTTVAVEVTELYLDDERSAGEGSRRRRQESLRQKFAQAAEDAFYAETPPGQAVNVSLHWLPEDLGTKELTPRLAGELAPAAAELVTRGLTGSAGALVRIEEDKLCAAGLGGILLAIQAREACPHPDGRASPWCSSGPSFLPTALGVAPIEHAIAIKEQKLAAYRGRCEEAWLLLSATGGPSSFDSVESAVLAHPFRSSFDRVVLVCTCASSDRRVLTLAGDSNVPGSLSN